MKYFNAFLDTGKHILWPTVKTKMNSSGSSLFTKIKTVLRGRNTFSYRTLTGNPTKSNCYF